MFIFKKVVAVTITTAAGSALTLLVGEVASVHLGLVMFTLTGILVASIASEIGNRTTPM
jgi:hypothetical protein